MEIIIPLAAAVVLWLIFTWSIKVFKVSIKTLLAIAAIFILLQVAFDISSQEMLQELSRLSQRLLDLLVDQIGN